MEEKVLNKNNLKFFIDLKSLLKKHKIQYFGASARSEEACIGFKDGEWCYFSVTGGSLKISRNIIQKI
jgi:hypothetical protein